MATKQEHQEKKGVENEEKRELKNDKWVLPNGRGKRNGKQGTGMTNREW